MAQLLSQPILLTEEIKISFTSNSKTLKAVDGVSFKVFEEDVLGLVGESGCGKTLTALSIMRLLPTNASLSGKILYKGEDLLSRPESELRDIRGSEISMVFQEPMTSLNPVFTVGYQIAEVLTTHKRMNKKYAMKEAVELLRSVRISSPEIRTKEYPHQLSGGMRQRVMIAMAIACRPSLIIADEPTTALDVTIQAQILELLDSLRRENKMSVLLITHDLGIVAEYVKRVEIMYAGRIVEEADVRDIFTNPRHPYTIGLLESLPKKKGQRLTPIPGQVPRLSELPQGCKFSTRCSYAVEECLIKEPELIPIDNTKHRSRCIKAMEI